MRTAKRLCVTDVTGLLLACFVVTRLQSNCARSVQISVDLLHKRSVSRTLFFKENQYHGFFRLLSSYFRTEGIATVYFKLLKCFPLLALCFRSYYIITHHGLGGFSGLINGLIAAAIGALSMLMSEPTAESYVKRTCMFVLSIATFTFTFTLHLLTAVS